MELPLELFVGFMEPSYQNNFLLVCNVRGEMGNQSNIIDRQVRYQILSIENIKVCLVIRESHMKLILEILPLLKGRTLLPSWTLNNVIPG